MEKKLVKGEWRTRLNANERRTLNRALGILVEFGVIEPSTIAATDQVAAVLRCFDSGGVFTPND